MRPDDNGHGSMSETTPQQKANLARIRDNQRRSRARRKEYLQELEAKYRSCEAVGAEASQEIQAAARKVLDENKRLRRLLRNQGFSDADIDGPEHDEYASSPSAAEILNVMLVTPKVCRPSSTSGCGSSNMCKTEDDGDDDDDIDSRRESVASTALTPVSVAPRQQKQLRPIALAPVSVPAPAPAPALAPAPAVAPVAKSQSQEPRAPSHQFPQQHHHQPQPQQHFFMSAPSHSSAPLVPHHNVHASPGQYVQDYPAYAPQPFGYPVPQSQLLDWDMAAAEAIPQPGSYPPQGQYASPASNFQPSYASPTHSNSAAYSGQDNTSSCFAAAGAIRALHEQAGDEVESALGCGTGGNECRVDNTMVFDLMDRYASVQGQQHGM